MLGSISLIVVTTSILLTGCYTQLKPPFKSGLQPNEYESNNTGSNQYTPYYYNPYSSFFYSRYDRWKHYYDSPWWGNDYWYGYDHNRHNHSAIPAAIISKPIKKNISTTRRILIPDPDGTAPAKKTTVSNSQTNDDASEETSDAKDNNTDKDDTASENKTKKKKNINQTRKITW